MFNRITNRTRVRQLAEQTLNSSTSAGYQMPFVFATVSPDFAYFSPMAKLDAGTTLKRLRNRYRLVVMNDDTYEEVVTFKLSRMSVYVVLSSLFVLLVGLTVALVVFTPVKYYIPGYGSAKIGREYRQMKYQTDSLEKELALQTQYLNSLQKVFNGGTLMQLDTTAIAVPREEVND